MNKINIPCEWAEQEAIWLTWPSMQTWWQGIQDKVCDRFAELAALVSQFEKVRINCNHYSINFAKEKIIKAKGDISNIEFFEHDTNDVWCRDSGAIFGFDNEKKLCAIDFNYNSWGGKFPPFDKDNALAKQMAFSQKAEIIDTTHITCEGGALEFSQDKCLLTTECVLLNKNRNPNLSKSDIENFFKNTCDIEKIFWLKDGLYNDDTDGHIDNLARFTPCKKVIVASCEKDNPSYKQLQENENYLKENSFEAISLPVPKSPILKNGEILPASYVNYLIINDAVIMPSYAQKDSDDLAKNILSDIFTNRKVIAFDSSLFLQEGGAVHCLTQQQPKNYV